MSEQVEGSLLEVAYQSNLSRVKRLSNGEISEEDLARELAREQVEGLKDHLTGLFTRKFFDQTMGFSVESAERYKTPLSLAILDVDNFKTINDTYGHPEGDNVLRTLGEFVKKTVRASDVAARYGGEEIVIILPNTEKNGAQELAERLLIGARSLEVDTERGKIKFTVSIGIAGFEKGMTSEELVNNTDKALYQAKGKGKNRIQVYG